MRTPNYTGGGCDLRHMLMKVFDENYTFPFSKLELEGWLCRSGLKLHVVGNTATARHFQSLFMTPASLCNLILPKF